MSYEKIQMISGMVSLLLFVAVFAGAVFWTMRPSQKERHEQNAQIPLNEE